MKMRFIFSLALVISLGACTSPPIHLYKYSGGVMAYPNDFSVKKPTILAFLDVNDRRSDHLLRPLRAISARDEVEMVGVMVFDDNSFLEQISTKNDLVFPVMLDPLKKMVHRFGVSRYPTFFLLSLQQEVVDRRYEVNEIHEWCQSIWIDKAMGRRHVVTPEEKVDSE